MDTKIIQKLRRYASHGIHELSNQDPLIVPIDELVQRYVADSNDTRKPISDKEVRLLINWPGDVIDRPFDHQTIQHYRMIGKKVLRVAMNPDSNNDSLMKVSIYLHPLFSQDDRTVDMSWDLEEYMDWYFKNTSKKEREDYAKQLIKSW